MGDRHTKPRLKAICDHAVIGPKMALAHKEHNADSNTIRLLEEKGERAREKNAEVVPLRQGGDPLVEREAKEAKESQDGLQEDLPDHLVDGQNTQEEAGTLRKGHGLHGPVVVTARRGARRLESHHRGGVQ